MKIGVFRSLARSVAIPAAFLCFSIVPAARAAPAPAAVIVYPPDKALLGGSGALELLGYRTAGSPATVTVTGKGGTRSVPVGEGSFAASVTLDPGENVLSIGERRTTVFLAVGTQAPGPRGFSEPDRHAVDNGCEDCHKFGAAGAKLIDAPPKLCAGCHDDLLTDKGGKPFAVMHPPAQEGDCLACHPFHGLSVKRLAPEARRELCFGCHDDFTGGGKKRMHTPVAKGECTRCHGPHGSSGKKLLPAEGVKLCALCHADPSRGKEGKEWSVSHPALDDGCPSCHLPHVSEAPGMLKKAQPELCADCHDPFPTQESGRDLLVHSPVEEGTCTACHAVHGSDVKKLLAREGKALCVECHDDPSLTPQGEEWASAHPALDDGCFTCHLPHVAPAAGMLKKAQAPLCFECHDAFPPLGPGGSLHGPVAQGRCAGCHAPHGSAVGKLLRGSPAKELCLRCHKDPSATPAGEEWAVPHPALDDGCTACHLPHQAPAPRLLARPQRELCAGCHEDKNLNADGAEWTTPHPPVVSGMCGSCHGPHGAPEKALLVKNPFEVCRGCHAEVHERHLRTEIDVVTGQPASGKASLPAGFPIRRKDGTLSCIGCHLPHGSDSEKLWNEESTAFCNQCHLNF